MRIGIWLVYKSHLNNRFSIFTVHSLLYNFFVIWAVYEKKRCIKSYTNLFLLLCNCASYWHMHYQYFMEASWTNPWTIFHVNENEVTKETFSLVIGNVIHQNLKRTFEIPLLDLEHWIILNHSMHFYINSIVSWLAVVMISLWKEDQTNYFSFHMIKIRIST